MHYTAILYSNIQHVQKYAIAISLYYLPPSFSLSLEYNEIVVTYINQYNDCIIL